MITFVRNYIDRISRHLAESFEPLATKHIRLAINDIDIDRIVRDQVCSIDWSEHIDYSQLAQELEIDYVDLCRYITIDSSELAEELKDNIQLSVSIK